MEIVTHTPRKHVTASHLLASSSNAVTNSYVLLVESRPSPTIGSLIISRLPTRLQRGCNERSNRFKGTKEDREMALPVASPSLWLPVLVLTAAADGVPDAPSPPPSRMPPPPSPPPAYVFKSSYFLRFAAREFDIDPAATIARYGPIADWDVSAISNMVGLFYNLSNFNADISSWNTSGVKDMAGMFAAARAFNQPLSFDTSRVTSMEGMFQVSSSLPPHHTLLSLPPHHTLLRTLPITATYRSDALSFRLGRAHLHSTSR